MQVVMTLASSCGESADAPLMTLGHATHKTLLLFSAGSPGTSLQSAGRRRVRAEVDRTGRAHAKARELP